jgi:ribonuclease R
MRLIEEFMLLSNKCVTEFVSGLSKRKKIKYPFIYRVHDDPDTEKLKNLSEFVIQFGYNLNVNDKDSIKDLLTIIKGKPEEFIINDLLIRSMAKAVYTDENIGHYGLGFDNYTHFTSPIRRYPDLIVHRMLYDYITEPENLKAKINNYRKIIRDVSKQCSAQEQNAVSAERETKKIKQIEYLTEHIGDEYKGIISGIVKYGIFVEITDLFIEGMVRFKDIEDDYYEFDFKNHCAVGLRKGKIYKAGEKVKIKVIKTDIATKKIDFIFV